MSYVDPDGTNPLFVLLEKYGPEGEGVIEALSEKILTLLEKGIIKLTPAQLAALNKLWNTIKFNLKATDFSGAMKEFTGGSTGYDHIEEMRNSFYALYKAKRSLEGSLMNQNLDSLTRTILQWSLNIANHYIQRIKDVFIGCGL